MRPWLVSAWLLGGCLGVDALGPAGGSAGHGGKGQPDGGTYHPPGYADPAVHGLELKLQKQDCRSCHGAALDGGSAQVSCDSCHRSGWRTNCTYCHGGAAGDTSGGPPRDINGQSDPTKISFPPHGPHAAGRISAAWTCVQCHKVPTDVLSASHIFDGTPGRAEALLGGGLASASSYDYAGRACNNNYCHGTGRVNGDVSASAGPRTCHDCHGDMTSTSWTMLSSTHLTHLAAGFGCVTCHGATVKDSVTIADKTLHLDGKIDVQLGAAATGITYVAAANHCTGTCHTKMHNYTW
jgi:hypothetical protein